MNNSSIQYLHENFGLMKTQVSTEENQNHSQKMESLGNLAGGMAHDMNNILASIMAVASAMDAEMDDDHEYKQDVVDILSACTRGSKLTRSLLGFARRHRMNKKTINPNQTIIEVQNILSRTLPKGINIVLDCAKDLKCINADPDQLNHVLVNMCINASDAMAGKGTLTIKTENIELTKQDLKNNSEITAGKFVRIFVIDQGKGIPKEILNRIFEPFFTTKPRGKGTGLGLAMAYGTIKKHGGVINIDSELEHGTSVAISLPAVNDVVHIPSPKTLKPKLPPKESGTVLLVDDESLFRASAKRILEKLGYDVLTAANGQIALEVYSKNDTKIEIVILDMLMPIMGGRETFHKLREKSASLPIIISSGFAEEESIRDILENGAVGFISKPFDLQSLSKALANSKRPTISAQ